MITFQAVSARGRTGAKARVALRNVTFEWNAGVFAVLGAPLDGSSLLLAVAAGVSPIEKGVVTVSGGPPSPSHRHVVYVPRRAVLPDGVRVAAVCELASLVRGEPVIAAKERLGVLGVASLADRVVDSLSLAETRAVAMALAITSRATVLLLDEPLASLEPPSATHLVSALRERAAEGASIVLTTSSVRDATRLGDRFGLLTANTLAPLPASYVHATSAGARLNVVVSDLPAAERLTSALAEEPGVTFTERATFAEAGGTAPRAGVSVVGPELLALASAVSRAAFGARLDVDVIESAVMPLPAIRLALAASQHGRDDASPSIVTDLPTSHAPRPTAGGSS